jgi:hypothetical protein
MRIESAMTSISSNKSVALHDSGTAITLTYEPSWEITLGSSRLESEFVSRVTALAR